MKKRMKKVKRKKKVKKLSEADLKCEAVLETPETVWHRYNSTVHTESQTTKGKWQMTGETIIKTQKHSSVVDGQPSTFNQDQIRWQDTSAPPIKML